MNIGDTITVTYEQSKQLRKEGWKPRNDVVVMMFVGVPEPGPNNKSRGRVSGQNTRQKQTDERWAQSYRARLAK